MILKYFIKISLLSFLLLSCNADPKNNQFPKDTWDTSTFDAQDLDQTPIDNLLQKVANGNYGNIDQLLIITNGKQLLNQSYTNNYQTISKGKTGMLGCGYDTCKDSTAYGDYNYYHPYYHPYYKNQRVHTLQSVTKSIASIMMGIAIDKGHISNTEVKVLDYFKDYDLSMTYPTLHTATLEDLLTMQLGMEWHELDRPADSTNTTGQLEVSKDWIQFTLQQPMDTIPGTKWVYNSGASQLMSGILKKATGQYMNAFAEEHLFTPLGIKNYHWKTTPSGYPDTEGGLFLKAEDLAKIGYLMLNKGDWDGQQIVSADWVKRSIAKQVTFTFDTNKGYGYQWWRHDEANVEIWACLGFGGQYLLVFPQFETIVVVNSWNIFDEKIENMLDATKTAIIEANRVSL